MATMNISLPDSLKLFVQERIEHSDFSNPSDYIRALIRADKERYLEQQLEQALLQGINSGQSKPINEQFWQRLEAKAQGGS
ncbi:MAG: type II toxin-antitoxin system ParD family antitoxin [Thiofilum sp.]|uniref:type II toxin-antitoxin system ParD family antitoxin n=1 Tax=Thiofilum sp. TaxID=2212733 RepID=UPI0025E5DB47|nr:type II toxin-antitoxin system ParD family antitoxin [Thiofilum sp.]MBK8452889.1 type II toxin-antitoxin system ParD family antitoxin [Thiofilum sp.]